MDPGNTAVYLASTPDGPVCRLPEAACSPMTAGVAGRVKDPAPGAGRVLARSTDSPEHAALSLIIIFITDFRLSDLELEFFVKWQEIKIKQQK